METDTIIIGISLFTILAEETLCAIEPLLSRNEGEEVQTSQAPAANLSFLPLHRESLSSAFKVEFHTGSGMWHALRAQTSCGDSVDRAQERPRVLWQGRGAPLQEQVASRALPCSQLLRESWRLGSHLQTLSAGCRGS